MLKLLKKLDPTSPLILLVLKLQLGRLVSEPFLLKEKKNWVPTVVMLFVLKLHSGKLMRAPPFHPPLKLEKKLSHTVVSQVLS